MDPVQDTLGRLEPSDLYPLWCRVDYLEQLGELPPEDALRWKHGIFGLMDLWGLEPEELVTVSSSSPTSPTAVRSPAAQVAGRLQPHNNAEIALTIPTAIPPDADSRLDRIDSKHDAMMSCRGTASLSAHSIDTARGLGSQIQYFRTFPIKLTPCK